MALGRACTVALKDLLQCEDAHLCAQRICGLGIDVNEAFESPRIVVSTSKCERQSIELAAKHLKVSSNQLCSALINLAIMDSMSRQEVAVEPSLKQDSYQKFEYNASQSQALGYLFKNGWPETAEHRSKASAHQVHTPNDIHYNDIHYIELGTGSGKTLLALTLATHASKLRKRTWIAVPSLAIQKQFLSEFKEKFETGNKVAISLVSGRAEFVSEHRLSALLDQQYVPKKSKKANKESSENLDQEPTSDWAESARLWMDRVADKSHGADRRRWLIDSFFEHVEHFPYPDTDICVTTDCPTDDPGQLSYLDQFDLADRADIVVLTHHYLCLETLARVKAGAAGLKKDEHSQSILKALYSDSSLGKSSQSKLTRAEVIDLIDQKNQILSSLYNPNEVGRLTLPEHLIVDEAHLLEENFSKASSIKISIRRLPALFQNALAAKAIKSDNSLTLIQRAIINLSAKLSDTTISNQNSTVFLNWNAPPASDRKLVGLVEDLATTMTEFTVTGGSEQATALRSAQYAFSRMLKAARYSIALFTNSPIRQYPQIIFGSSNHTAEFRLLFKQMGIEKTLFLSATMYLPNMAGAWSSSRFLQNLGLQTTEAIGYRAAHPSWLTDPVSLYLAPKPSDISQDFGAGHNLLLPSNDKQGSSIWISQLAKTCQWVANTAQGGTLVLMTSYDSAAQLHERLLALAPELRTRLLLSKPRTGFTASELKREFIAMYKQSIKPIWIAVGTAWTGLNLSDPSIEPGQDNLLTDLIIPRMPYGLNRSISSAAKSLTAMKHIQSLEEAGLTLKQGIGRLIRRPGLPKNRRLFFLDSRIYEKDKKVLLNMSTALLKGYSKTEKLPRALIKDMLEFSPAKKSSGKAIEPKPLVPSKPDQKPGKESLTSSVAIAAKTQTGSSVFKRKNVSEI